MWRTIRSRVGLVVGGLLLAGMAAVPVPAGETSPETAWLERTTQELLRGCRVPAADGTQLYTPDGKGNYRALWTRDFAYMVEHAGDLMPPDEVEAAIRYLVRGVRADGATPDRVQPDGLAVFAGGAPDRPLGEPNLDNGPFLVIAVDTFLARRPTAEATARWREWSPTLRRALEWTPRSPRGLVWNDPARPHSPYGFTDTVGKTGELFFESLLYWTAARRYARLEARWGEAASAREFRSRARAIERGVDTWWDADRGAFLAATHDCRQLDVWGNAYAIWLGFPLGRHRGAVLDWLSEHRGEFLWHGQVRHLPRGEYWNRLLAPVERERYQNGAYWATASGWMICALAQRDRPAARQAWQELIDDFRAGGVCECVNTGYRQLPSYVVSATNPLSAARRLGW